MTDRAEGNRLEATESNVDYKDSEAHIEEIAIARLTEEDLFALSQESLRFKSWTTFRIALIMIVQGCNQAGYGIDWAVISGINAFDHWVSELAYWAEPILIFCSTHISDLEHQV